MAHRDAVVDRDRVELLADAAGLLDLLDHQLAEILEMNVAGHELRERVGDRDDRLLEVAIVHADGAPERPGARHVATGGTGAGTLGGQERFLGWTWVANALSSEERPGG